MFIKISIKQMSTNSFDCNECDAFNICEELNKSSFICEWGSTYKFRFVMWINKWFKQDGKS